MLEKRNIKIDKYLIKIDKYDKHKLSQSVRNVILQTDRIEETH